MNSSMNDFTWFEVSRSHTDSEFSHRLVYLASLMKKSVHLCFGLTSEEKSLEKLLLKLNGVTLLSSKLLFLDWMFRNSNKIQELFQLESGSSAALHELNYQIYLLEQELLYFTSEHHRDLRGLFITIVNDLPLIVKEVENAN